MTVYLALYLATVLGAAAVALLMPTRRVKLGWLGGLLGIAALGLAWIVAGRTWWSASESPGLAIAAYYYVFSLVAIVSAVKVITSKVPVYSALWFVMVVVASAGLLVSLAAEFMAFAMLIIYGGAILVTYMFVIMLASQSSGEEPGVVQGTDADQRVDYDRVAREPLWAVVAGFSLLAVLLGVGFEDVSGNPAAGMQPSAEVVENILPERGLTESRAVMAAREAGQTLPDAQALELTNGERVGLDLFQGHPLTIELAGIILLVSLVGAVVIAKARVAEEAGPVTGLPGEGGATAQPTGEAGPDSDEVLGSLSTGRMGL